MFTFQHKFVVALASLGLMTLPVAAFANSNTQNDQQQTSADRQSGQTNRQNEQSQENEQTSSQNSQDRNQSQSGTVLIYRDVNSNGEQHFRVRLQTGANSVETVDLGPSDQNQDLIDNIEQGDHINVQGQMQKIDGKHVFVADRARVDGKSYAISETNGEQASNNSEQNQSEPNTGTKANASQHSKGPNTLVLLDERFVFLDEGNLNRHLILAKEDLRMGDTQSAAGELRVAAQQLDLYANGSNGRADTGELIKTARQDLDRLADQISKGQGNVQPDEIGQAAARAQLAIAKFYDDRNQNEQGASKSLEAGYALQAAAMHTREALMWSGENVPPDAAHSVRQALRTADQLISGNKQPAHDATQAAQNLGQQIDQISQQIGENQAQPASERLPAEKGSDHSQQQ
jgi:hypothetical protein